MKKTVVNLKIMLKKSYNSIENILFPQTFFCLYYVLACLLSLSFVKVEYTSAFEGKIAKQILTIEKLVTVYSELFC